MHKKRIKTKPTNRTNELQDLINKVLKKYITKEIYLNSDKAQIVTIEIQNAN